MRLYGAIEKVEAGDDGTVRVYGVATSEGVDEQGEIVRASAMRAAIPDYMRFPALREMHQLSAAGSTLEAEVAEDGTTRIVAHVVDPVAVTKVKNQVYRGFSIGGRITQRDAGNPKIITGLVLNEISLVDRPANPEAVFDCWKASSASEAPAAGQRPSRSVEELPLSSSSGPALQPFNSPIQVWACWVPEHRHLAKTDASRCLEQSKNTQAENASAIAAAVRETASAEKATAAIGSAANAASRDPADGDVEYADPGYQADGTKRYPIDTEAHIRVAWNFINNPDNAEQYTADQLRRIRAAIIAAWKTKIDQEGPPSAENHQKSLRAAVALAARSDHSPAEQALLDLAYMVCEKCLKLGGLSADREEQMGKARDHLHKAGATATPAQATTDAADDERAPAGNLDGRRCEIAKIIDVIAASLRKRGREQQQMMDMAHECLRDLTGGKVCGQPQEIETRASSKMILDLEAAHRHLIAAGAGCEGQLDAQNEAAPPAIDITSDQATVPARERAESLALAKVVGDIMPMLERLTKRVDEIARTPLPPLTMAKGMVSLSKQQDRNGSANNRGAELAPDTVVDALAKMSKEEQTLTLIKASYANPIRMFDSPSDELPLPAS